MPAGDTCHTVQQLKVQQGRQGLVGLGELGTRLQGNMADNSRCRRRGAWILHLKHMLQVMKPTMIAVLLVLQLQGMRMFMTMTCLWHLCLRKLQH